MPSVFNRYRRVSLRYPITYNARPFHRLLQACILCFCSLVTLLILSNVPAYAEWEVVEKDYRLPGFQTVYVDPDTIRREGNLVTMWQLIDFKWMQGSARGPARFMSTKTHKQFNCAEKRVRLLAFSEFSHHMGTGIQVDGHVDTGNWMPVEREGVNQALWEMVCGRE